MIAFLAIILALILGIAVTRYAYRPRQIGLADLKPCAMKSSAPNERTSRVSFPARKWRECENIAGVNTVFFIEL